MPIDDKAVQDYMNEMADAAGIAQDARPAFLASDKVKAVARKRFEDVEREKGRVTASEQKRQEEYQENMRIYGENKKAVDAALAQVAEYETRYGKLDSATRQQMVQQATEDNLSRKTFDEEINKRDMLTVGLVKSAAKITARHLKNFNEEPDFDAIEKLAIEKRLTAEQAYDEWVKPRVQARDATDLEARLKAAREEGYRDGVSKQAAGQVTDAAPKSGFFENMRKQPDASAPSASSAFNDAYTGWKPPVRSA